MRYMPAILAKLFQPALAAPAPPTEAPPSEPDADEVGDRLDAAVAAHAAEAAALQHSTRTRTRLAIDEVLQRMDQAR